MPESGTYGSVRGVPGNRHPYRDRRHHLRRGTAGAGRALPRRSFRRLAYVAALLGIATLIVLSRRYSTRFGTLGPSTTPPIKVEGHAMRLVSRTRQAPLTVTVYDETTCDRPIPCAGQSALHHALRYMKVRAPERRLSAGELARRVSPLWVDFGRTIDDHGRPVWVTLLSQQFGCRQRFGDLPLEVIYWASPNGQRRRRFNEQVRR